MQVNQLFFFVKYALKAWLCIWSAIVLQAQTHEGDLVFRQYTLADGLPDRTIYGLLQDQKGYIWIATSQGIIRFDGYRFWRPPGPDEGYSSAFYLQCDNEGRIWFQRLNGTLWRFEGDSIRPWPYNDRILKYKGLYREKPMGYFQKPSGAMVLALEALGFLEIQADGRDSIWPSPSFDEPFATLLRYNDDNALLSLVRSDKDHAYKDKTQAKTSGYPYFVPKPNGGWVRAGDPALRIGTNSKALRWAGDSILVHRNSDGFALFHRERLLWKSAPTGISSIWLTRLSDGSLILCDVNGKKGFYHFANLDAVRRGKYRHYLEGYAVTQMIEDADGGWWISTWADGIFYVSNPKSRIWDERHGLPNKRIAHLCKAAGDTLYMGMLNGYFAGIRTKRNRHIWLLPRCQYTNALEDMAYDLRHQRLWAANNSLFIFERGRWEKHEFDKTGKRGIQVQNIAFSSDGSCAFLSCYMGIQVVKNKKSAPLDLLQEIRGKRIWTAFEDPKHRVWVGSYDGLYTLEDNALIPTGHVHPLFSKTGPKKIGIFSDSLMYFGFRSNGVLIRYPDGRFVHIGPEQGLLRDKLNTVADGGDGKLLIGSSAGLFVIGQNPDGAWQARHFTMAHGLPDPEITAICRASDGTIFLGSAKGLCLFDLPQPKTFSRSPQISQIEVAGLARPQYQEFRLRHGEDFLRIHFITLNYRALGNINYRYRLGSKDAWNYTKNTYAELLKLPPNAYRFEVQSANEDGVWSQSAVCSFVVEPPWWKTLAFRIAAIVLLLILGVALYSQHLQGLRHKLRIEQQFDYLERESLMAQMNPHFVFNCLNLIQNMVLSHKKEDTIEYIGAFAGLLRRSMEAAKRSFSLQEEIKFLEDYLKLEKRRSGNRFDYAFEINVPDPRQISLPPLLIQPLVENAILHGFHGLERQGHILIRFELENQRLLVEITDNGIGIEAANAKRQRPSISGNLLIRRLSLINKTDELHHFQRYTLYDEQGNPAGAKATLWIRV